MQNLSHEEFDQIYSKVPRLCVDLIIKYQDGFLLTKRVIEPFKGLWHTPGGTVFYGESLEKAVARIAKEETGAEIKINKMLGVIEYVDEKDAVYLKKYRHAVSLVFFINYVSGELKTDFQATEIKTFKEAPADIILEQGKFIDKYLQDIIK